MIQDVVLTSGAFLSGIAADLLTHFSIFYRIKGKRLKAAISVFAMTLLGMLVVVHVVKTDSYMSIFAYAAGRFVSAAIGMTWNTE